MDIETLFNLPAHPLLVHIPVVCVPLAAIGAVLIALRPRWRRTYGPIVVALALVGAVGAVLAAGSGEALQEAERIRDLGDHGEFGEVARNMSLLLLVVSAALVGLDRWAHHPRLRKVPARTALAVAALTVIVSVGAVGTVVAAGHTGAERVWEDDRSALGG